MGQARVTLEHLRASCRQGRRAVAQGEGAWHIDAGPGRVAETQAGISALSRFTAAGEVCLQLSCSFQDLPVRSCSSHHDVHVSHCRGRSLLDCMFRGTPYLSLGFSVCVPCTL